MPTVCQYCVVGCGYEARLWDEGEGEDSGPPQLKVAHWVSPAMTGRVRYRGAKKVAAIVPDPKCSMNRGNHSPRGGSQGRNITYSPSNVAYEQDATRERITSAYVRTQRGYEAIETQDALHILAELIKEATGYREDAQNHKVLFDRPGGLGVKLYEYQYLENTYAATKLLYQLVGTPNVAYHDRPSVASNTQGFNDSGVDPHGYAYDDIWDSDVLFLAGNNAYECHSVFFMQYMTGKRIIVLDPRRTITADYAEKTGGLHLQPKVLGANTLVLNALARYIVQMQDDKPDKWPPRVPGRLIADAEQLARAREKASKSPPNDGPTARRQARYQMSWKEFLDFLETKDDAGKPLYTLERAEEFSGIPVKDLMKAAQILAGPENGMRPPAKRMVSLIFEKGLIWGYSYQNTAVMANLGLLLGSVLRPTDPSQPYSEGKSERGVTGRAGGHQKGWAEVRYSLPGDDPTRDAERGYPFHTASDLFVAEDGTSFRTHHNSMRIWWGRTWPRCTLGRVCSIQRTFVCCGSSAPTPLGRWATPKPSGAA